MFLLREKEQKGGGTPVSHLRDRHRMLRDCSQIINCSVCKLRTCCLGTSLLEFLFHQGRRISAVFRLWMKDLYVRVLLKPWKVLGMLSSEISSFVTAVHETKVFLKCTRKILFYVRFSKTCIKEEVTISWFQTFAVFWILYVFFWVFPRRLIVVCRRFGTLYQFHLQRLNVEYEVYFILHIQPLKMEQIEWVFPRRLIMFCRRFGTLYLFHLQRRDVQYEVYFILHIQPLKMEQIECSETSVNHIQTPGKYPKEYRQVTICQ